MNALAPKAVMKRLEQTIWMLDYLDDIDADFLRFYQIDGYEDMHSVRFFRLVWRLPAYQGALSLRLEREQEAAEKRKPGGALKKYQYDPPVQAPLEDLDEFIERG